MSQRLTQCCTLRYTQRFSGWLPSALARALEWSGVEAYQGREYLQSDEVVAGRVLPLMPAIGKAGEA